MSYLDETALRGVYNCLLLGVNQAEIGARYGITQARVSQLKNGRYISNSYRPRYLEYKKKLATIERSNKAALTLG